MTEKRNRGDTTEASPSSSANKLNEINKYTVIPANMSNAISTKDGVTSAENLNRKTKPNSNKDPATPEKTDNVSGLNSSSLSRYSSI